MDISWKILEIDNIQQTAVVEYTCTNYTMKLNVGLGLGLDIPSAIQAVAPVRYFANLLDQNKPDLSNMIGYSGSFTVEPTKSSNTVITNTSANGTAPNVIK
jgi:hypothetical protein